MIRNKVLIPATLHRSSLSLFARILQAPTLRSPQPFSNNRRSRDLGHVSLADLLKGPLTETQVKEIIIAVPLRSTRVSVNLASKMDFDPMVMDGEPQGPSVKITDVR